MPIWKPKKCNVAVSLNRATPTQATTYYDLSHGEPENGIPNFGTPPYKLILRYDSGQFPFLLHSFISQYQTTEPSVLNPKRPLPGIRIDKLLGGQDSALLFFWGGGGGVGASYFCEASGFRLCFTV